MCGCSPASPQHTGSTTGLSPAPQPFPESWLCRGMKSTGGHGHSSINQGPSTWSPQRREGGEPWPPALPDALWQQRSRKPHSLLPALFLPGVYTSRFLAHAEAGGDLDPFFSVRLVLPDPHAGEGRSPQKATRFSTDLFKQCISAGGTEALGHKLCGHLHWDTLIWA